MNVFSFDIAVDMAFFKKSDANYMVYTSYNFLHKPAKDRFWFEYEPELFGLSLQLG